MCLTSTLVGYRVIQSDKVSIQVHPVSARTQQLNFSAKIQGIKIWEGREEKRWPSARVLASAQTNTVPQIWWLINVSSYSHVIQLFIFLFIYLFIIFALKEIPVKFSSVPADFYKTHLAPISLRPRSAKPPPSSPGTVPTAPSVSSSPKLGNPWMKLTWLGEHAPMCRFEEHVGLIEWHGLVRLISLSLDTTNIYHLYNWHAFNLMTKRIDKGNYAEFYGHANKT
jgi:hypothetical protein